MELRQLLDKLLKGQYPPTSGHIEERKEVEEQGVELEVVVPTEVAVLPPMFAEVLQQVLDFLSGLAGIKANPTLPSSRAPIIHTAIVMASRMDKASWTNAFLRPVQGSIMTGTEDDLLTKFQKMKPPTFQGIGFKNTFEFIIDCYKRLHKMDIVQ